MRDLRRDVQDLAGVELEVFSAGEGPEVLVLHGLSAFTARSPFLAALAGHGFRVIAPSHPGFGGSARPDWVRSVRDLVNVYLDLLDELRGPVALVGLSFGGWLAAEVAIRYGHRLTALVLVDALGIKVGGREAADVFHLFNEAPAAVAARRWVDAAREADPDRMEDGALVAWARDREALCRYGWQPFMHDPGLRAWLRRIRVPTEVIWGAQDGIVSPEYGRAYAAAIPGAGFMLIPGAAHQPEVEQPAALAEAIASFLR